MRPLPPAAHLGERLLADALLCLQEAVKVVRLSRAALVDVGHDTIDCRQEGVPGGNEAGGVGVASRATGD